ncbi:hypothetical protein E2562_030751 [Oryza meyeriana var. granulata]|uniref:Uncharacterized protein n=1 Tax=Oryza meyeriana var. granulata TaxID=110450 RepID=A0A6G1E4I3_9ORYZ|nr:hypothetical protein E2562_030751 [Oryza meyeriana var. granulata]
MASMASGEESKPVEEGNGASMVARQDGVVRGDSLEEERTQGHGGREKEADDPEFYRATCGCVRLWRRGNRGYTLLGIAFVR